MFAFSFWKALRLGYTEGMVEIITDYGFCAGVKRAIGKLREASRDSREVYLTHPLLHNREENGKLLKETGAKLLTPDCQPGKNAVLVFSAHGHRKEDEEKYGGCFTLVDATCPVILAREKQIPPLPEGARGFLLGKAGHPETLHFLSLFPDFQLLTPDENGRSIIQGLPPLKKGFFFVPQTTVSPSTAESFKAILSAKGPCLFSLPVCPLYSRRLGQVLSFFQGKDPSAYALVVVGDALSSNANELLSGALKAYPSLLGTIALKKEGIDPSFLKRRIVLASATSASEAEVLALKEELEKAQSRDFM